MLPCDSLKYGNTLWAPKPSVWTPKSGPVPTLGWRTSGKPFQPEGNPGLRQQEGTRKGAEFGWASVYKSSHKPETSIREKQVLHNRPGSLWVKELPGGWEQGKVTPEHRASLGYLGGLWARNNMNYNKCFQANTTVEVILHKNMALWAWIFSP